MILWFYGLRIELELRFVKCEKISGVGDNDLSSLEIRMGVEKYFVLVELLSGTDKLYYVAARNDV